MGRGHVIRLADAPLPMDERGRGAHVLEDLIARIAGLPIRAACPAVVQEFGLMATKITEECINCGACEPECPNQAISQGEDIFVIDPKLCTECVGFHDEEACAAVCPVDCCVPDPAIVESEQVLFERAKALHADKTFPQFADLPASLSRFRKAK